MFQFFFKKINLSTYTGFNCALFAVTMSPAVENTLSDGTDVVVYDPLSSWYYHYTSKWNDIIGKRLFCCLLLNRALLQNQSASR